MADQPTSRDIEFVIAQGEALVSQARGMVAQWEQSLVQLGITPEVVEQIQSGAARPDLPALLQAPPLAADSTPIDPPVQGPSLQSARRALRRLRHV